MEYKSQVLVGYNPSSKQCFNWELSSRYELGGDGLYKIYRTVWDNPQVSEQRTLIDICETPSAGDASTSLDGLLVGCNVGMQDGPNGLGDDSRINPDGERNAVYFNRANICVTLICYGREDFDLINWANNIDDNIISVPQSNAEDLVLTPSSDSVSLGNSTEIDYSLEWSLGEFGFYKFFTTNGELSINDNKLTYQPSERGEAIIDGFAIEEGKPTYSGRLLLEVV